MFSTIKRKIFSALLPARVIVFKGEEKGSSLYLTFDDGPNAEVTPKVLDLLQSHHAKATFFCIGKHVRNYPELMERIVSEGHLLANHSMNHRSFGDLPLGAQRAEITDTDQLLAQYSGTVKHLFRAPRGDWSVRLLGYLTLVGVTGVHWSYDSEDFRKEPANAIVDRFKVVPPKGGEIILFHDDHVKCVDALSYLLPIWKEQGFTFESMDKYLRGGKK